MALAQITTFGGRWDDRSADLIGAVHAALVATLRVPEDDPTVWHRSILAASSIVAGRHGRDAVLVEVTIFSGRSPVIMAALHADVSRRLAAVEVDPATCSASSASTHP